MSLALPLGFLRSIALRELGAAGCRPLFVTISGAHLYGFASPDSDFDIRGCYLRPLRSVLSLHPGPETLEYSGIEEGRELDFVSHDAGKFFGLMLRRNGYVMEQIFSPLVVFGGPHLDELRDLARGCLTRNLHHHYRGFADNELKLLAKEKEKSIKRVLYVHRVLMTGIHVLRTGEIEANLPRLLGSFPEDGAVGDLIAAKTRERATLSDEEFARHEARIQRLRGQLETAFHRSTLPDEPARAAELDAFLFRLRTVAG